jgi:hypothetical protein
MRRTERRRKADTRAARELEEIHCALLALDDDLTETIAWTAFVFDGVCGMLGEQPMEVDSATHSGMRFATIWLKQRNQSHASTLKAACKKLREIRGQQGRSG